MKIITFMYLDGDHWFQQNTTSNQIKRFWYCMCTWLKDDSSLKKGLAKVGPTKKKKNHPGRFDDRNHFMWAVKIDGWSNLVPPIIFEKLFNCHDHEIKNEFRAYTNNQHLILSINSPSYSSFLVIKKGGKSTLYWKFKVDKTLFDIWQICCAFFFPDPLRQKLFLKG